MVISSIYLPRAVSHVLSKVLGFGTPLRLSFGAFLLWTIHIHTVEAWTLTVSVLCARSWKTAFGGWSTVLQRIGKYMEVLNRYCLETYANGLKLALFRAAMSKLQIAMVMANLRNQTAHGTI